MTLYSAKIFIERAAGFHNDALHVIAGVLLALAAAALLRRSLAQVQPWLIVFGLELANELNDYFVERWPNEVPQQMGEIAKDILLTMALPTLLLLVARKWPQVLTGKRQ